MLLPGGHSTSSYAGPSGRKTGNRSTDIQEDRSTINVSCGQPLRVVFVNRLPQSIIPKRLVPRPTKRTEKIEMRHSPECRSTSLHNVSRLPQKLQEPQIIR